MTTTLTRRFLVPIFWTVGIFAIASSVMCLNILVQHTKANQVATNPASIKEPHTFTASPNVVTPADIKRLALKAYDRGFEAGVGAGALAFEEAVVRENHDHVPMNDEDVRWRARVLNSTNRDTLIENMEKAAP